MTGTFWAFMPAIIAIVLALVTKQVYVSLFLGIFVGAMMYVGGNPISAMGTVYEVMSGAVGGNTSILVFLVVLGILVYLAVCMCRRCCRKSSKVTIKELEDADDMDHDLVEPLNAPANETL